MNHILDNPIWNALHSGNQLLCHGNDSACFLKRDVGLFAGLKNNSEKELKELSRNFSNGDRIILFVPAEIIIPSEWNIVMKREILQMVYDKNSIQSADNEIVFKLSDEHIPMMLELTRITNPGPFFNRTIDLGNYEGIFVDNRLVAMTGRRLNPSPYMEVSAVCTHPQFTGKGYAAMLVKSQVKSILEESMIPFLHLYPDNTPALKLYEKLGFELRKTMFVYFLENLN